MIKVIPSWNSMPTVINQFHIFQGKRVSKTQHLTLKEETGKYEEQNFITCLITNRIDIVIFVDNVGFSIGAHFLLSNCNRTVTGFALIQLFRLS